MNRTDDGLLVFDLNWVEVEPWSKATSKKTDLQAEDCCETDDPKQGNPDKGSKNQEATSALTVPLRRAIY